MKRQNSFFMSKLTFFALITVSLILFGSFFAHFDAICGNSSDSLSMV